MSVVTFNKEVFKAVKEEARWHEFKECEGVCFRPHFLKTEMKRREAKGQKHTR